MTENLNLERMALAEAGSRIAQREGKGDVYKIRIMGWEPGAEYAHGSSADYPVEALKRDVPTSFPEGTRMRANHDGFCEAGGDIRRVISRTIDTPWEEADGMYTHMRVSEQWSEYVREYGDIIGLSISAAGEMETTEDEDGNEVYLRNEETDKPILKRLMSAKESPYNSIDFVEAPGADGRIVMAIESAQKTLQELNIREAASFASGITERKQNSEAVPPRNNKEESPMTDVIKGLSESESTIVEALAVKVAELMQPKEAPKAEISGTDVAEAAIEAGLSKVAREAVYDAWKGGRDYTEAIERETVRESEIEKRVIERLKTAEPEGYTTSGDVNESDRSEADKLIEAGSVL